MKNTDVKYRVIRNPFGVSARVTDSSGNQTFVSPRFGLAKHSPDGFEFGYGGSGPAQLALGILADFLDDDERAVWLHQKFKDSFTGNTRAADNEFVITGTEIVEWLGGVS